MGGSLTNSLIIAIGGSYQLSDRPASSMYLKEGEHFMVWDMSIFACIFTADGFFHRHSTSSKSA